MHHFTPSAAPDEGLGILLLFRHIDAATPGFFTVERPILVTRAPGRLDVMGGIADYSGATVLQLPIAEAACVALQPRADTALRVWSPGGDGARTELLTWHLDDLGLPDAPIPYAQARALFAADPRDRWVAYILGCLLVLAHERGLRPTSGFNLLLRSDVPEGIGVSSSAAIEVASMRAIAELHGIALEGREVALLCQRVENEIVGAPCGVMDQMAAACGGQNQLLALLCQPCEIQQRIAVPEPIEFVGIDSGVRHAVAGSDYGAVRAGAFAGARILQHLRGLPVRREGALVLADDPEWGGYLVNCPLAEFHARWAAELPEQITGAEFLRVYGGHGDRHTRIEPERTYQVRVPTAHPIEEHARVARFRELLAGALDDAALAELGDLMFAAHDSYSRCGLGHPTTDFLVDAARQRRAAGGKVFGAKVTGGGSGGTVVLMGLRTQVWYEALRIKKALLQHTGHSAQIFRWSTPGAMAFGTIRLDPKG